MNDSAVIGEAWGRQNTTVRTVGGNIIETGSDSYRLAHTKARRQATAGS
ncbi:hypothetical protein ABT030_47430 [Streptomyces mirabilis]